MSDYRFGVDDYGLNYYPKEAEDESGHIDWDKVEHVEIDWVDFVRERECEYRPMWDENDLSGELLGNWYTGCGNALTWNADNDGWENPPAFCPYCGGRAVER